MEALAKNDVKTYIKKRIESYEAQLKSATGAQRTEAEKSLRELYANQQLLNTPMGMNVMRKYGPEVERDNKIREIEDRQKLEAKYSKLITDEDATLRMLISKVKSGEMKGEPAQKKLEEVAQRLKEDRLMLEKYKKEKADLEEELKAMEKGG